MTNRKSFESVEGWKKDLAEVVGEDFPCALVANKIDLANQRKISEEEGFEQASDLGMSYYETSAKTGQHVDDAFQNLLILVLDKIT